MLLYFPFFLFLPASICIVRERGKSIGLRPKHIIVPGAIERGKAVLSFSGKSEREPFFDAWRTHSVCMCVTADAITASEDSIICPPDTRKDCISIPTASCATESAFCPARFIRCRMRLKSRGGKCQPGSFSLSSLVCGLN